MEYIDLRKVGREGLKEIRWQVVRLKKLGKTGKEIEELSAVSLQHSHPEAPTQVYHSNNEKRHN